MGGAGGLLAGQRRALILAALRRNGGVRVGELTAEFGVSEMTVRRDLDALERRGSLRKVHGGAVPAGPSTEAEPVFREKAALGAGEKRRIGRAASLLLPRAGSVAFGGGTTVRAVARAVGPAPGLTVVTNSLPVAELFHGLDEGDRPAEVVLTGGVRTPSDALVGPVADAALAAFHVDVLVLGAHGLGVASGLTTPNLAEAATNARLLAAARRVVLVADATKWRTAQLRTFAGLGAVDVLVTDAAPPPAAGDALRAAGVEVRVAPPG
ncbi:DeoR/GlpR transcriptional regulator [Streptomyces lonarensis]|uniref:DeoR/GlpR transcriptional regulator n=1 Tax=Streptomyces lonarensis TaxID=700599 RepID=A0A7X6D2S6_9ACTN|nr:DeoR/GlpR transcriptional regulator [Streptomyces lonarensis]